ncbi:MAG: GGDEF domain-containing protein [Deltaproteobacteria bacterium]|nr:GGDEF domain-containing protein [Deltaproteobacteria bacterium]MBW2417386.1 GGDEF domain-containing protein [Deltaproteobacteria bacterium]
MTNDEVGEARVLLLASTEVSSSGEQSPVAADLGYLAGALEAHLERRCESAGAFEYLRFNDVDLVILDAPREGIQVGEFAEQLGREHPGVDLLVLGSAALDEHVVRELDARGIELHRSAGRFALVRAVERILEERRLARENRRLRDSLHVLERCRELTPCLEAGQVYPLTLDLLLEALSRSRGVALFHRTFVPESEAVAFRGFSEGDAQRLREVLFGEKPIDLDGYQEIAKFDHGNLHKALEHAGIPVQEVLSIPIRGPETEYGVVWVFEDGRRFEAEEAERARVIANHAVEVLSNCERYHQAKERAFIDDVTEIYNARYLLAAADNEIRRAARYENALSVLFLDLDRFKLVNDRHGHLVGSQTLRKLSQILTQCVREVDTLARYGGDEFTILLVDTAHNQALAVAERIRRTVEEQVFEAGRDASLRVTLSMGVATFPDHGEDRESLIDAADKAMYRAKSKGRNRVCSADELADVVR